MALQVPVCGNGAHTSYMCGRQARMLLGMSADEVAPLKEAPDPKPYEGLLERVAWSEWLLRVQSRTQCAPPLPAGLLRTAPGALRGAGIALAGRSST